MVTAYFDDSGTHASSKVVLWGGLIGIERQWLQFESDWKAKLHCPLPGKSPLSRFHMAECQAADGEFKGYTRAEIDAVTHDFREIILDSGVYGYAAAVFLSDWDEILGRKYRGRFSDAEFFCMTLCVNAASRFARDFTHDRFVNFVFDDRKEQQEANKYVLSIYQEAFNQNAQSDIVKGISFFPSVNFAPLQGADMIAWETFNHAQVWRQLGAAAPARAHLQRFVETGRFISHVANRNSIEEIRRVLEEVYGA